jgi:hypothetical protein
MRQGPSAAVMKAMHQVRNLFFGVALAALGAAATTTTAGQQMAANSLLEPTTKPALSSLKIALFQKDDTPFTGKAFVRVVPDAGFELMGVPGDAKGEFVFFAVAPGKYSVEAMGQGMVSVRVHAEVDVGGGERTVRVVLEPGEGMKEISAPVRENVEKKVAEVEPAVEAAPDPSMDIGPWRPHELEETVPPVDEHAGCSLNEVLHGAGQRMMEFVTGLEKFAATEHVEHFPIDKTGARKDPDRRQFSYVVTVSQNQLGTFLLDEYRNAHDSPEDFPEHIATHGLPAMALIFHPVLASDFNFKCEGLGKWGGTPVWQVHFAQRDDRRVRIRSYVVNGNAYAVYLEGRAWIDPKSFDVIRMESELMKPVTPILLTKERLAISYAPVKFPKEQQSLWLPREAEMYVEQKGRRYYRRHTFSDFKLFTVATEETWQPPKGSYTFTNLTDHDVEGQFTVGPEEGARGKTVVLSVKVPARGRVVKIVGRGKDVNLSAGAVGWAKFVYNGDEGEVKVDANLAKETMLDVVPEKAEIRR